MEQGAALRSSPENLAEKTVNTCEPGIPVSELSLAEFFNNFACHLKAISTIRDNDDFLPLFAAMSAARKWERTASGPDSPAPNPHYQPAHNESQGEVLWQLVRHGKLFLRVLFRRSASDMPKASMALAEQRVRRGLRVQLDRRR